MENQNQELFKEYQLRNEKSYNFLMHGVEILRTLLNRNYEAYIIGSAVRNLHLKQDIDQIEIVTNASMDTLKQIFPVLSIDKLHNCYLSDKQGKINFSFFDQDDMAIVNKNAEKYYNKKLTKVLQNKSFTIDSLAITPNLKIIDIFGGLEDLENMIIKTIDKPKVLFNKNPKAILDALELMSMYGFNFYKKTLKATVKYCTHLENIKEVNFISQLRQILKGKYAEEVVDLIKDNQLFKYVHLFDIYITRIAKKFNQLSYLEVITILYLYVGKIPDATLIEVNQLQELTENITIAQLVASDSVTPMMIYNIGVNRLLSANKMALLYKHKYLSQEKLIKKLNRKAIINNIRELNFTKLELITLLNGDRSIKIKIIMNLLLEKVINGEVINHAAILKNEALKLNDELKAIFEYEEPILPVDHTEETISELNKKYHKEYDFLVKVYLNDEKELYNLSALEREEVIKNAKDHAKAFLLETSQYKILEERGLI